MLAQKQNTSIVLGEVNDVSEFAKRIKKMMRGGEKLSETEATALAQFSFVTGLNPFIGECWYISGSGPMVGIAGARRLEQQLAIDKGGVSFPAVVVCDAMEAGASEAEAKDVAAAFRVEINDSVATAEYLKMFTLAIEAMKAAGVSDPFGAAKEICGPRPVWVGYGFAKKNEPSRMSKVQLARKRAEADALKKRIVIPFGAQLADSDVAPEYVDVVAEEVKKERRPADKIISELTGDVDKDYPVKDLEPVYVDVDEPQTETTELTIESTAPGPQRAVRNEIITDSDWQNFTRLVNNASKAGIVVRNYNRNEMTATLVYGASKYLSEQIAKLNK